MRFLKSRTATVIAATLMLIGGANLAAYAATGGHFLLGESNSAGRTTGLTNTGSGAVLALKGSTGSPPLTVNSSKVVSHLNADMVDGKHASAFQPRGGLVWHPLSLASGIAGNCNTGTPAYAIQFGVVYLQGDICSNTSSPLAGGLVFTLPASARPHRNYTAGDPYLYLTVDECDTYTGRIEIDAANGHVYLDVDPQSPGGTTCFASLEGVSFPIS
ncbi:MAG: hypothetical protein ACTHJM_02795 [Marmoricola sp.]